MMKQSTLMGWRPERAAGMSAAAGSNAMYAPHAGSNHGGEHDKAFSDDDDDDDDDDINGNDTNDASVTTPPPPANVSTANTSMSSASSSSKRAAPDACSPSCAPNKQQKGDKSDIGSRDGGVEPCIQRSGTSSMQLCHHHRAKCSTPVVQCTRRKKNGDRCRSFYCAKSLAKFYAQDRQAILANKRNGKDDALHVSSAISDYIWSCPKCLGECVCSVCRKQPSTYAMGMQSHDFLAQDANSSSPTRIPRKSKPRLSGEPYIDVVRQKTNGTTLAKGKGKAETERSKTKATGALDIFFKRESASDASVGKGTKKTEPSTIVKVSSIEQKPKQQSLLAQHLSPPKPVSPPAVHKASTRLPVDNILARMWLYETLVRFDAFDVPKKVLSALDRFDSWSEDQLLIIFERLLCFLCEIGNVKVAPQGKKYGGILKTYQDHRDDPKRGEAWHAVLTLCRERNINIPVLVDVEILPEQVASALRAIEIDPGDTLLGSRSAGSRRAATTAALARVKSISAKENRKHDDGTDDEDDYATSRASRRKTRKIARESDSETDEDISGTSRRSGRKVMNGAKARIHSPQRRSLRNQERAVQHEEGSTPGDFQSSDEKDHLLTAADASADSDVIETSAPVVPVDIPPFEQRIAILCGFAELLMQKKSIADEIVEGVEKIRELERQLKDELKGVEKQHDDEMRALQLKRSDMHRVGKGKEWAAEHDMLAKDHEFARIDVHMSIWLPMEAHKARAGPLGTDTDGNQYWQLTEFNESMPVNTEGQWSWSLLVLGRGFPAVEKGVVGTEDVMMETTDQGVGDEVRSEARIFFDTNNVDEIGKLIAYIRYRQKKLDYDEMREEHDKDERELILQQRRIETELQNAQNSPSKASNGHDKSRQRERVRAKEDLAQAQELRRSQIDVLIQRLTHVKEYYQWHAGSMESPP